MMTPDSSQSAVVARSLLRGHGYTIDYVRLHLGLYESVRHVPEMHGLLHPLLLAPFFALLGAESHAVKWPGVLFMAASGLLAFSLGRRLLGPMAGLLACAVTLSSPALFQWARAGTDDAGFAFLFLLTVSLLERALTERRQRHFFLAGVAASFAVLEKPSGFFLLGLLLAPLLLAQRESPKRALRWTFFTVLPFVGALGLYFARNYFAHGGLMFRFSSLEWLWKAAPPDQRWEAFRAIYDPPPSLREVLGSLGAERVVDLVVVQLQGLWAAAAPTAPFGVALAAPPVLLGAGLVATLLLLRRKPVFSLLTLASTAGSAAFICGLYHLEARYFLFLTAPLAIALAGVATGGWRDADRGWASLGLRAAASLVLLFALGANLPKLARMLPITWPPQSFEPCQDIVEEILSVTQGSERLLTFRPGKWTWEADRESVVLPAGGEEAIARIARHYEARWIVYAPFSGRSATSRALGRIASGRSDLRAEVAVRGRACLLLRLELEGATSKEEAAAIPLADRQRPWARQATGHRSAGGSQGDEDD
jgi:4-amino-4-deoxy-L-arabinose transferase-like glycosyltransferase